MVKQNHHMIALQKTPVIGPMTCTAFVATATCVCSFDSGRQIAAGRFANWVFTTAVTLMPERS